jgi:hypothetical protein
MWHAWGTNKFACGVLVGKYKGRRQFGSPRYRWKGNINMDLKINWMVWRKVGSAGVK